MAIPYVNLIKKKNITSPYRIWNKINYSHFKPANQQSHLVAQNEIRNYKLFQNFNIRANLENCKTKSRIQINISSPSKIRNEKSHFNFLLRILKYRSFFTAWSWQSLIIRKTALVFDRTGQRTNRSFRIIECLFEEVAKTGRICIYYFITFFDLIKYLLSIDSLKIIIG